MSDEIKKRVLAAFQQEGVEGSFNVWRYDTPSPECVLWGVRAVCSEEAVIKALNTLTQTNNQNMVLTQER